MIHYADKQSLQHLDRLSTLIRALIPAADLVDLTDEELEVLSGLDASPATLCGPNLLRFHNQMREQAGVA